MLGTVADPSSTRLDIGNKVLINRQQLLHLVKQGHAGRRRAHRQLRRQTRAYFPENTQNSKVQAPQEQHDSSQVAVGGGSKIVKNHGHHLWTFPFGSR